MFGKVQPPPPSGISANHWVVAHGRCTCHHCNESTAVHAVIAAPGHIRLDISRLKFEPAPYYTSLPIIEFISPWLLEAISAIAPNLRMPGRDSLSPWPYLVNHCDRCHLPMKTDRLHSRHHEGVFSTVAGFADAKEFDLIPSFAVVRGYTGERFSSDEWDSLSLVRRIWASPIAEPASPFKDMCVESGEKCMADVGEIVRKSSWVIALSPGLKPGQFDAPSIVSDLPFGARIIVSADSASEEIRNPGNRAFHLSVDALTLMRLAYHSHAQLLVYVGSLGAAMGFSLKEMLEITGDIVPALHIARSRIIKIRELTGVPFRVGYSHCLDPNTGSDYPTHNFLFSRIPVAVGEQIETAMNDIMIVHPVLQICMLSASGDEPFDPEVEMF